MITPTPRLIGLSLLAIPLAVLPSVVTGPFVEVLLSYAGLLLLGLLVDTSRLIGLKAEATSAFPTQGGVGDPLKLAVAVGYNRSRRLIANALLETSGPIAEPEPIRVRLAKTRSRLEFEVTPFKRGPIQLSALWIELMAPLGLMRRTDRVAVTGTCTIVPSVARVTNLVIRHFGADSRLHAARLEVRRGDGTEFDALEQYEPGMDLRRIDWKASARHLQLRARHYRLERNQRLIISLDVGRLMSHPLEGMERLDHAIHASLLLSHVALRQGDLVGLHAYSDAPQAFMPPKSGVKSLDIMRHSLSALRADEQEANHVLGMTDLLSRLKRRSLVVVMSDFADSIGAELMIQYVSHLARKHLVVFFTFTDDSLEAPFTEPVPTALALARVSVADELMSDRDRVFTRLRAAGVNVVTGAPTEASLALLTQYIDIKRRALIG